MGEASIGTILIWTLVKAAILLGFALGLATVLTWMERRQSAMMQDRIGPTRAISVTFLIPACAALWGWAVLGEVPTAEMVAGCAVILLGTALATGILKGPGRS